MEPVNRKFIKVVFVLLVLITLIIEFRGSPFRSSNQSVLNELTVQKQSK